MTKENVIDLLEKLPEEKVELVAEYIQSLLAVEANGETTLRDEQKRLLGLLDHTISTGRGDFAENHDHYLYGTPK